MVIDIKDFSAIDIHVGTITKAEIFPESRKAAIKIWIDFGRDIGEKKSSAQITKHYSIHNLIGQQVAAVTNLKPRQIGPFMSEVLVLGFPDSNGEVVLIHPGHKIANGGKLF